MKRTIQGILLAGSMVLGGTALAQGSTTQGGMQGSTQGQTMRDAKAQGGKAMVKDGMVEHMGFMVPADQKAFLERLHHINQMEIQLGRLAQQKGQSQDVKSFGEMLVRDHTAADQRVMSFAQTNNLKLANTPRPMNDMERKHMAAEKAMMEKLQTLTGQAFDSAFLAHMVSDHDMALGKVMAAQQHFTGGELSPLLQQASQSIASHRQQAYSLLGRNGPGAAMGVGGAGTGGMDHKGHMSPGMGGAGNLDKGQSGSTSGQQGSTGSGDQKK